MRLGDLTTDAATTDSGAASGGTSWLDVVKQAVPTLVQARYQDKLLSENFKRAQQGLPPLNADDFKPGVTVGLDAGTKKLLAGIAVAVAVVAGVAMAVRH